MASNVSFISFEVDFAAMHDTNSYAKNAVDLCKPVLQLATSLNICGWLSVDSPCL